MSKVVWVCWIWTLESELSYGMCNGGNEHISRSDWDPDSSILVKSYFPDPVYNKVSWFQNPVYLYHQFLDSKHPWASKTMKVIGHTSTYSSN